jgi:hypothetical protein
MTVVNAFESVGRDGWLVQAMQVLIDGSGVG